MRKNDVSSLMSVKEDGSMCIMKEDMVDSIDREPVYRCREKLEETCHDTFVTVFSSHTEEECVDHFEKKCQISFRQVAALETIVNCYK